MVCRPACNTRIIYILGELTRCTVILKYLRAGPTSPRTFIHSHKTELEAWDPQTWKQVQSSFEALKVAWEARKRAAESQVRALGGTVGAPAAPATRFFGSSMGAFGAYGGGVYQPPQSQEIDRLNAVPSPSPYPHPCFLQLIKEADSNIGTPFVPCL
jgi:hypothetical protein